MPVSSGASRAAAVAAWRSSMNPPSISPISTERLPSASFTGAPPAVTTMAPAFFARSSVAPTSVPGTRAYAAGILQAQRQRAVRHVLDLHDLEAHVAQAGDWCRSFAPGMSNIAKSCALLGL